MGMISTIRLRYFANRPTLQKVLSNISWLFIDKVLRMGVGLFVMAWVARYLGPEQFGLWNYAIAFTSLFGAFATLGLDGIVVRELVKTPEKTNELLGTAFVLRLIGSIVAFTLSVGIAFFTGNKDPLTLSLIALSAGGFIFQAFLTIDYFYQAHIISKYTVWSQNLAFLIMSVVKIVLIILKASLLAFAVAGLIEIILGSIFLIFTYLYIFKRHSHIISNQSRIMEPVTARSSQNLHSLLFNWSFSKATAKSLLKDSWPLIIGSISALIYMRIDLIMVKELLGNIEAGYYTVAQRISESFLFLTVIITQTVFPVATETKKISKELYYRNLLLIYGILTKIAFIICLIIFFSSELIIRYIWGEFYIESIKILQLYVWTSFFVFLSNGSWIFYINENLQKFSMYRLVLGALVNVVLNIILIKRYGLVGAAVASLISYSISSYFFNAFSRKLLLNFKLQTLALLNLFNPASYIEDFNRFRERRK